MIFSLYIIFKYINLYHKKDLKDIVTNEKIEDTFSIDFFRYDAPGNLLETSNIALVKSIYSDDEISQMICESIDVCFE